MTTERLRWVLGVSNTSSPPISVAAFETVTRRRSGSTEVGPEGDELTPAEPDPAEDLDDQPGAEGMVLDGCC